MRSALAAACLSASLGCGPTSPLIFEISAEFSAKQQALVRQAANDWNCYTEPSKKITFELHSPDLVFPSFLNTSLDGVYRTSDLVFVRPNLPDDRFLTVVTHEFGHVLGLQHIPLGEGIMDPVSSVPFITNSDVNECRRVGACY